MFNAECYISYIVDCRMVKILIILYLDISMKHLKSVTKCKWVLSFNVMY